MADIQVTKPANGQQVINNVSDGRLVLDFPVAEATMERVDNNLVFNFEDGSSVTLQDFYTAYNKDNMPTFEVDGQEVKGEDFFAALGADLAPAAGPAAAQAANGGRFHDFATSGLVDGLTSLGAASNNLTDAAASASTLGVVDPGLLLGADDAPMAAAPVAAAAVTAVQPLNVLPTGAQFGGGAVQQPIHMMLDVSWSMQRVANADTGETYLQQAAASLKAQLAQLAEQADEQGSQVTITIRAFGGNMYAYGNGYETQLDMSTLSKTLNQVDDLVSYMQTYPNLDANFTNVFGDAENRYPDGNIVIFSDGKPNAATAGYNFNDGISQDVQNKFNEFASVKDTDVYKIAEYGFQDVNNQDVFYKVLANGLYCSDEDGNAYEIAKYDTQPTEPDGFWAWNVTQNTYQKIDGKAFIGGSKQAVIDQFGLTVNPDNENYYTNVEGDTFTVLNHKATMFGLKDLRTGDWVEKDGKDYTFDYLLKDMADHMPEGMIYGATVLVNFKDNTILMKDGEIVTVHDVREDPTEYGLKQMYGLIRGDKATVSASDGSYFAMWYTDADYINAHPEYAVYGAYEVALQAQRGELVGEHKEMFSGFYEYRVHGTLEEMQQYLAQHPELNPAIGMVEDGKNIQGVFIGSESDAAFGWMQDYTTDAKPADDFSIMSAVETTINGTDANDVLFGDNLLVDGQTDGDALNAYLLENGTPDSNGNIDIHSDPSILAGLAEQGQATDNADIMKGGAGDDILLGMGGNDKLYGDDGADYLFGGQGNDYLDGGDDTDVDHLYGGSGNDIIVYHQNDVVDGGTGVDFLIADKGETLEDLLKNVSNVEAIITKGGDDIQSLHDLAGKGVTVNEGGKIELDENWTQQPKDANTPDGYVTVVHGDSASADMQMIVLQSSLENNQG